MTKPTALNYTEYVKAVENLEAAAKTIAQNRETIRKMAEEYDTLRNEHCLMCGNYKGEHYGACNGCRWR